MNEKGQVSDLDFEGIPDFIRGYLRDYAKPMTMHTPGLAKSFLLFNVVEDLEAILKEETLDVKKAMPMLWVLWTNLIARMARIETITTAQQNLEFLTQEEDSDVEDKNKA